MVVVDTLHPGGKRNHAIQRVDGCDSGHLLENAFKYPEKVGRRSFADQKDVCRDTTKCIIIINCNGERTYTRSPIDD
jgi:hypothetical protein